jgi:hypothetical protein
MRDRWDLCALCLFCPPPLHKPAPSTLSQPNPLESLCQYTAGQDAHKHAGRLDSNVAVIVFLWRHEPSCKRQRSSERYVYEQDYVMKSGIISQKGFHYFLSA